MMYALPLGFHLAIFQWVSAGFIRSNSRQIFFYMFIVSESFRPSEDLKRILSCSSTSSRTKQTQLNCIPPSMIKVCPVM